MAGEKNWLIRTTRNQIFGPISKEKLIEFLNKNALRKDDEVSSGNGYWFHLNERDLVERYIFGDIIQGFNPISEAPTVLTSRRHTDQTGTMDKVPGLLNKENHHAENDFEDDITKVITPSNAQDDIKLPESSDLEFPDMDGGEEKNSDDVTLVLSTELLDSIKKNKQEVLLPNENDLAFPDMDNTQGLKAAIELPVLELEPQVVPQDGDVTPPVSAPTQQAVRTPPERPKHIEKAPEKTREPKKQSVTNISERPKINKKNIKIHKPRNDRYLFFVLFLLSILVMGVFYYYLKILNKPLPVIGIGEVNGQEIGPIKKKF